MEIEKTLKALYNITVVKVKKQVGYDTQNFLLESESKKYILKKYIGIAENAPELNYENEVLTFLSEETPSRFPQPISNISGKYVSKDEEGNALRVLSYLEGSFFSEVSHTPELFTSLGRFIAEMDLKLLKLKIQGLAAKEDGWDLQHFLKNEDKLDYIKDAHLKKLVHHFIIQYKNQVLPYRYKLRKSIIHSDANEQNILVEENKVTGFIDFGDMCYSPLINELAIALTYAIIDKDNPLEWATYIIKAYHEILPLEDIEIKLLYYLIAARLCTSLLFSSYSRFIQPENDYATSSEKSVIQFLKYWVSISPEKATNTFFKAIGKNTSSISTDINQEVNRRSQYFSKAYSLSYSKPIKMVSAAFQYMFDADGNTYLDAYNNIPLVGHSHPRITEAAQQQIALLNTNTRYLYDNLHEYAERLLAKFPAKLNKIFFVNSGSAASDLAMRLARAYSNKKEIAVMEYGYHGNTQQCIDISSYKADGKGGKGLNDYVYKLPLPDAYKGEHTGKDAGILYAQEAINLLNSKPTLPGAFIAEPIIGCGGQIPLPDGYLQKLYEFLQAQNILCISDEVQVGMGRLGSTFWGFEQHGVIPDIVIIGKPIGNGHPMAAVVCTEEVAQAFENGMEFFSSFGGNPVSCSIGNAVLDVLEEENLQQHAKITGEHLIQGFKTLAKNYAQIGDVRGSGLFLGIEIVDQNGNRSELAGEQAAIIKNKLRDKFILSSTDGPYESVLKFKPPLCFNTKNADQLLNAVEQILKTM